MKAWSGWATLSAEDGFVKVVFLFPSIKGGINIYR
jgi:hypothetical protein